MKFIKILFVFIWIVLFSNKCFAQDNFRPYITINDSKAKYSDFNSLLYLKNFVTKISIVNYNLSSSFDTLYQFFNLKEVEIMACNYNHIPKGISKLYNLEILYLDYTDIITLPKDFRYLENLKKLRVNKHDCFGISNCDFQIPIWINELTRLESLDFKDCLLTEIPDNFYLLKNLKSLFIMHSNLTEFPYKLLNIKSLESVVYLYGGGKCPINLDTMFKRFECAE